VIKQKIKGDVSNDVEKVATHIYTTDDMYRPFNTDHRGGRGDAKWPQFTRTLTNAVEHFAVPPADSCTLYRGQPALYDLEGAVKQHGNAVDVWNTFTSCSTVLTKAVQFAGAGVVLEITGRMPRTCHGHIDHVSFYPNEEEVLILPGTAFRVVSNDPAKAKEVGVKWYVKLECIGHIGDWSSPMNMRKAVEEAAAARKAAEQRAAAARAAAEANMTTALFHGKHPVGTLLRKEPKLDRNFNGYELVNDLRVRVLEKNAGNGMTKVEYAGQLGFVRSEYLSKYREEAKVSLTMERKAAEEKAAAEKGAAARKAEAAAAARKAEAARRRNAAVGKVRVP